MQEGHTWANPLDDELNCITTKYLTESADHTTNDPELARILSEAEVAFATEQERKHRQVIPPVSSIMLPLLGTIVSLPYLGEGKPLPHGDPPISMIGQLPQPLGKKLPPLAQ